MKKGPAGVPVVGVMVALCMVLMVARQSQAIDCGQVSGALSPCLTYLINGGTPSSECCNGVKGMAGKLTTQQDRRAACDCVKSASQNFPNIKADAASNLPSRCGVSINIPISPSTNCQNIP